MMSKARGLAALLGFALTGIVIGFVLGKVLLIVGMQLGGGPLLSAIERINLWYLFEIVGGLGGIWVAYKKIPNPRKLAFSIAMVFVLALPAGLFVQSRQVRMTREDAARANLASSGSYAAQYKLGKLVSTDHNQKACYEVLDEQGVIGEVSVSPFLGFLWKGAGGGDGPMYRQGACTH